MMAAAVGSLDASHASRAVHQNDATLLARAAKGDDRAFAEIYDAHRKRLYRVAYGVLLDPSDAREAVQEAFLRLHQAAPTWEPRAVVGTWLYRVVLNHCLSLKQRLLRLARPSSSLMSRSTSGVVDSPEEKAALGEAVRIVERSLVALPMRQRAVACLFLEAEMAPAEIAPLVSMTPNAARVTLHRALARIRADLTEAGIDAAPTPDEAFILEEV